MKKTILAFALTFATSHISAHAASPAEDFVYIDTHSGATESIPGNNLLERNEWYIFLYRIEDQTTVTFTSGLQLYDFDDTIRTYAAYGLSISYHFLWMDTDRSGDVNLEEYTRWRECISAVKAAYEAPGKQLPADNWKTFVSPADLRDRTEDLPLWPESLVIKALDSDKDRSISRVEWKEIYQTSPTESGFGLLDLDHNKLISGTEVCESRMVAPKIWKKSVKRAEFFGTLDKLGGSNASGDGVITLSEMAQAWRPGVSEQTILSAMKRMRPKTYSKPLKLREWITLPVIPSVEAWRVAQQIREIRDNTFSEIRGTYWFAISKAEFAKLYTPGTSKETISKAWVIATKTPPESKPPAALDHSDFIECKLVGAMIK